MADSHSDARRTVPGGSSSPIASAVLGASRAEGTIAGYQLLFELAAGGMGRVYVARRQGDARPNRLWAVKRMHDCIASDPDSVAAFRDEARIAAAIRHDNVVALHEVIETEGEYLLVLDYVEGISLASLLGVLSARGTRLPVRVTVRVLIDALRGLHAAHELLGDDGLPLGLVHRDATPHNILLGADGRVRLTDFGIARAAERAVRTDPGFAKGKFAYMAPEHAFAEPIDRRADIFSMGVVAWEALVCRRLWESRSIREIARGAALGDIAAPSSAGAACAPAVDRAVLRALAPWRDQRWPTAAAFADALYAAALEGGGVASAAEVADAVDDACGPQLAARRARLSALTGPHPAPPATPSGTSDREAHTERRAALGRPRVATPLSSTIDVPRSQLPTVVDGGTEHGEPRRSRRLTPLLAPLAAAVLVGALWVGRAQLGGQASDTAGAVARAGIAAHAARVVRPPEPMPQKAPATPARRAPLPRH